MSKDKWSYMFYTLGHPMDGFYWVKRKDRGSVPIAIIMVALFSVSFTLNRLFAGFIVNEVDYRSVDSLKELMGILACYLLLCVSNWSITCLMNGEGRLKDIAVAIGYGTFPITISFIVATIVSRFLADGEEAFYGIILTIGIVWGIMLMLIGIMQVHNYSLGKTLITLFLTFIALFILIFLILLLANLLGSVFNFFRSIYTEIIFW